MTQTPWDDVINGVAAQLAPSVGWTAPQFAALMRAHMKVESSFDPTAYHWDGPDAEDNVSRGLMQIEGITAKRLGQPTGADTDTITGPNAPRYNVPGRVSGMYDPYLAIPIGGRIIRDNLLASDGDLDQAIAAYNEGPSRARADAATGSYRDQAYVDHVRAALADEWPADSGSAPPPPQGGNGVTAALPKVVIGIGLVLLGWWLQRRWT